MKNIFYEDEAGDVHKIGLKGFSFASRVLELNKQAIDGKLIISVRIIKNRHGVVGALTEYAGYYETGDKVKDAIHLLSRAYSESDVVADLMRYKPCLIVKQARPVHAFDQTYKAVYVSEDFKGKINGIQKLL